MSDVDHTAEGPDGDRYFIDRRNVCNCLMQASGSIPIFSLYRLTGASPNNLARIFSELIALKIIGEVSNGFITLEALGRARIVARGRDFFFPALEKTWNAIPNEFVANHPRPPEQTWLELPSSYRRLKIRR